jgi:hypothetical protein
MRGRGEGEEHEAIAKKDRRASEEHGKTQL